MKRTKSSDGISHTNIKQSLEVQANKIIEHIQFITNRKTSTENYNRAKGCINKLYYTDHVPINQIKNVINWYTENYDNDYMPIVSSVEDFYFKFNKIEFAMKRNEKKVDKVTGDPIAVLTEGIHEIIADRYVNELYKPALKLLGSQVDKDKLAINIKNMCNYIDEKQKQIENETRNFVPSNLILLKNYIGWLNEQDNWLKDIDTRIFDVNCTVFNKFIKHQMDLDNGMHPINGKR